MSKIDKLSILGIRSFDNTRSETIQFHTPLTLIVGYNGSGKTTIIECLKYATTGDLPPNSKGGAFIHDPKLCGEKEVLAQVKLSFKGTSGAKMVATRSLQLTVKKAARQQKTLEGQLLMVKDGERTAISSRVAELDQIMPQYLGVSKAILDSVIFCHQDESLWPMSEPSVLKKKFDEIFEAMKYTKAIDNIKVLRKKQNEELAKYRIMEQHSKEDKDKADKAEKRAHELHDELEALRDETRRLGQDIKHAMEKAQENWDHARKFVEVIETLKAKRIEAQTKRESVNDLKAHIKEMTDSDDELVSILEQYTDRLSLYESQIASQKETYEDLKADIEKARQLLGSKQTEVGKYEAEQAHHEQQVARRETLIKETARRHNIRGYDTELTEDLIREFMGRITRLSKDQDLRLDRARDEIREEVQRAQGVLNQLGERRSALNQSKNFSKQQISANDRKANEFQSELDKIAVDEGGKAALESNVDDIGSRLAKAKRDFEAAGWDEKLHEHNSQLRSIEEAVEQLNAEMIAASRQAEGLGRLNFLRKELRDRQRSLETMLGAHRSKIADALGHDLEVSSLEKDFLTVLEQRKAEVIDAERQRNGTNTELEQVAFKLKGNRDDLKRKREEIRECEKHVRDSIDGQDPELYHSVVDDLENDRDSAKYDADGFTHQIKYYARCVEFAKKKNSCQLCARKMKDEQELQKFIQRLQEKFQKYEKEIQAEKVADIDEKLKAAREAGPSYDTLQRLSLTEVPSLESEITKLEGRHDSLLGQVEKQDNELNEREELKRNLEGLSKTVQNITKYHNDIVHFEGQITELQASQERNGLTRSVEMIQAESDKLMEKGRSLRSSIMKLTSEKDSSRAQITGLELELRDIKSKLTNATYQLEKRASLVARVEEIREHNAQQRETMERADRDLDELSMHLSQAQTTYDDVTQRGAERERKLQQESSKVADSLHQLKLADSDINAYIEKGGEEQLTRAQREVTNLEQEITQHEAEQRRVVVEINKTTDLLKSSEDMKRSISDNLRYRRDRRALDAVNAEITELEAQNAEVDREQYNQEAEKWGRRHAKLNAEQASKMGVMKTKDDQLAQLLADWETDYKDAADKYKESHIKVQTTKAAVEDLGRYGGALDKAIMKYHSLKMEEINRIIEELWKRTYQGTDVDTILIRSDNENAKGNRSYNYRVCMVKQDAEMDMRGRCSAGQKVLASIIIRLALAECFGVNCGLIALDEPTTNLDRDNIRSLAESLHDIIRARQQQSNFQLIVITHDEEFLRYMQCGDFCDNYYRVSRSEKQKSIIERQSIAEVL